MKEVMEMLRRYLETLISFVSDRLAVIIDLIVLRGLRGIIIVQAC